MRRCGILPLRPIIYGYLEQVWNGVNSIPVHTFIQPEPDDILHFCDNLRVLIVEVRLFGVKLVQVVLLSVLVPCPGRAPKYALPVVWRISVNAVRSPVAPHVIVGIFVFILNRLYKPLVFVTGVVRHEIQN